MDSDSYSDNESNGDSTENEDSDEKNTDDVEIKYMNAEHYEKKIEEAENGTKENKIKFFEFLNFFLIEDQILRPQYQDITPSFTDEVPFLVDGDSLLITLLNDENWSTQFGGSSLHLVYLFERYLNIFVQRGGKFHLIFFQTWRNIWQPNWNILLHRSVLINHFSKNIKQYTVHLFDHCFDEDFTKLVSTIRPGFILTNMDAYKNCWKLFKIQKKLLKYVMNIHLLNWLQMDLPCINTNFIEVNVSIVKGFYLDCNPEVRGIIKRHYDKFFTFIMNLPKIEECIEISRELKTNNSDIREEVYLYAAYFYYKKTSDENMIKIFFIKLALMEFLELKNRCCPKFLCPVSELDVIVTEWLQCMYFALAILENENYNFKVVSDLWHGILFGHVYRFLLPSINNSEELGMEVSPIYENLVKNFNNFGFSISEYPIVLSNTSIKFECFSTMRTVQRDPQFLATVQNPLVLKFCSGILDNIRWYDPPTDLFDKKYSEEHHYHTMKVISDECDRIKDTVKKNTTDRWKQRRNITERNKYARHMCLYGSSIEGRPLETSGVIRNINKSSKEQKQKTSKKAQEIIESNIKKKLLEQENKDKQKFEELEAKYKKHDKNLKYVLETVNLVLTNKTISTRVYFMETLFLKLKILNLILKNHSNNEDKIETEKSIFLITRQILYSYPDLSNMKKLLIAKSLTRINCSEIAKRNNLPIQIELPENDDTWIRFQLKELGSEVIRESDGKYDCRVKGFIPDAWQSQLFDIIDSRQSALIVAPTSSGKTYASYYCMESILREGAEGVIIYVSPTKALVNQVAATVYARFKDTNMPPGQSVYGIFTRDYKKDVNNSQILVTVPQCLEVLLLSPRRYTWLKRLRYVIFDEIHCIEGDLGGASFERCLLLIRCPFLALSATIRNPDGFHHWLQKVEDYKYACDVENGFSRKKESKKVHLIQYLERHSDLTKFTYGNGQLHHLHPYAVLEPSVIHQHNGIPPNMSLSPAETLQLFDTMFIVNKNSEQLRQLAPIAFFSSLPENGFITKNLVKQYASALSSLLEKWFKNQKQQFLKTINMLKPTGVDQIDGTGNYYIIRNIANLIIHLKQQNMLPAIVFSYNRSLVRNMTKVLTKYFENNKEINKSHEKEISKYKVNTPVVKPVLDQWETKKYKQKALNTYSGNHKDVLNTIDIKMKNVDKRNLPKNIPYNQRVHKPLNLISDDAERTLQGIGVMNSEDIEYIELQLRKERINSNHFIANAIRNGFCMHHGGVGNKVRQSVEILFRKKLLNVVFATGTLALGIHVPCKTTVIAGCSAFFNSLEYHQTSGRAGRRGFDNAGNVIFFGLNRRKQHTLLTANLPTLKGNFPITVSLILRSLLLISDVTDNGIETEEAKKICISRIMTMLENSLCYESTPNLKINIKHFFSFSMQLLKIQDFINNNGEPLKWCALITHLHYHEPGNFAFVYLLRTGVIRKLCTDIKNDKELKHTLLLILCYLFTKVPLDVASKNSFKNSKVYLDPLPKIVYEALEEYNGQVHFVFNQYLLNVANYFNEPDNMLPLSSVQFIGKKSLENSQKENLQNSFLNMCVPKLVCSSFAALSGNKDDDVYSTDSLISNLKQKMATDIKVIPLINLNQELNGYALDFYTHGIVESIRNDNGLKEGSEYTLLTDFLLVLKTICVSLEEMNVKNENDIVYKQFKDLEMSYTALHNEKFGIGHF